MPPARVLLFPVDDTDESQSAFDWLLVNIYRDNDEVNSVAFPSLLNVSGSGCSCSILQRTSPIDDE